MAKETREIHRHHKKGLFNLDDYCDFCNEPFARVNGYVLFAFDLASVAIRVCDTCLKKAKTEIVKMEI